MRAAAFLFFLSRARILAQQTQKLIMIISDDTLSDANKGFFPQSFLRFAPQSAFYDFR